MGLAVVAVNVGRDRLEAETDGCRSKVPWWMWLPFIFKMVKKKTTTHKSRRHYLDQEKDQ
jgi:hypothetical protein